MIRQRPLQHAAAGRSPGALNPSPKDLWKPRSMCPALKPGHGQREAEGHGKTISLSLSLSLTHTQTQGQRERERERKEKERERERDSEACGASGPFPRRSGGISHPPCGDHVPKLQAQGAWGEGNSGVKLLLGRSCLKAGCGWFCPLQYELAQRLTGAGTTCEGKALESLLGSQVGMTISDFPFAVHEGCFWKHSYTPLENQWRTYFSECASAHICMAAPVAAQDIPRPKATLCHPAYIYQDRYFDPLPTFYLPQTCLTSTRMARDRVIPLTRSILVPLCIYTDIHT